MRGLDDRLPLLEAAKAGLRKAFPDHWAFLLGEIALYSLVVLLLTGTYLTFFFEPSMREVTYEGSYGPLSGLRVSSAYASTLRISFDVRGGLLIRQMHHWAALVFVAAIGVHMLRVFLTGAFRKPREANWLVGVTMLLLALVEGFAGYSLPDDLLSGTGLRTAQGIMLSLPVVGTYASLLVFGGEFPGQDIVPRLYPVHILLVPGLLVALVSLHLMLVVHLKHTQWAVPGSSGRNVLGKPFFPQYMAKSAGLLFMVGGLFGVLGALAQINPVWAYGPYRPDVVSIGSQPDWYVGFLEGALRLMPGFETRLWGHTLMWNPLVAGIVLPGLLFAGLYAYPFFERWITPGAGNSTCATGRGTGPPGPRSGSPYSPVTRSCCWPARRTSSPSSSRCPSRPSPGHCAAPWSSDRRPPSGSPAGSVSPYSTRTPRSWRAGSRRTRCGSRSRVATTRRTGRWRGRSGTCGPSTACRRPYGCPARPWVDGPAETGSQPVVLP